MFFLHLFSPIIQMVIAELLIHMTTKIKPNKKSLVCVCSSLHSHHCLTLNVCSQILCSYFILIGLSFFAPFLLSFIAVTVFIWYIIVCISLYILFICLYIFYHVIYIYIFLSFLKDNICALLYIAFFYLPIFPGNQSIL